MRGRRAININAKALCVFRSSAGHGIGPLNSPTALIRLPWLSNACRNFRVATTGIYLFQRLSGAVSCADVRIASILR